MVEAWRERGQEAEAIDIAGIDVDAITVRPGDDIGLASPTHGCVWLGGGAHGVR